MRGKGDTVPVQRGNAFPCRFWLGGRVSGDGGYEHLATKGFDIGAMPARRFPPPWSVEETDACFIVRDANGQALAYVYFEDEPGRRSAAKPCG